MATLLEDIKKQSDWIVKAFGADKLKLDYTLNSLKVVDQFFDLHSAEGKAKPNGRLSQNLGPIIFSIGSYVGETIIRNAPGSEWVTNDEDPQGEVNAGVKLPNGILVYPMQRVMKRFKNGPAEGIYGYGAVLVKDIASGKYGTGSVAIEVVDLTSMGNSDASEGGVKPFGIEMKPDASKEETGKGDLGAPPKKWWQFRK